MYISINLPSYQFQKCLGAFNLLTFKECHETGHSRYLSNGVIRGIKFRKNASHEAQDFFLNVEN